MSEDLSAALRRDFAQYREFLWGLCYRMTGSAADADDLVQDTFERALRNPPHDLETSLRPWLSRVAVNLSCDQLRRRKLQPYRGTWLPEPVPTANLKRPELDDPTPASRYELLESATFAFLIALEALTPQQRAVLLLRDVFDYSVRETAAALELGDANVKTTLHRAHQAMADYDRQRCIPDLALRAKTLKVLSLFLLHLTTDNVRGIEALLREDVVAVNDPGEGFVAARKLVTGRRRVVLFHRKIVSLFEITTKPIRLGIADINGLPALVADYDPVRSDFAPRQVMAIRLDADGCIAEIHDILAAPKLQRINFSKLHRTSWPERALARFVRGVYTRMQPADERLSPHIQVHPRSRARRA